MKKKNHSIHVYNNVYCRYHPNVAGNGDICVNTLKKDWTPDVTLKHVLQVIRCLLIVPFPESSLNDEAGKLFMDSYEEFARRARIMTEVHALPVSEENDIENLGHAKSATTTSEAAVLGDNGESAELRKKKDAKKKSLKRL